MYSELKKMFIMAQILYELTANVIKLDFDGIQHLIDDFGQSI